MDILPHEYLTCSNYTKEQIRITFFIDHHKAYVKLSLNRDGVLSTCSEMITGNKMIGDAIRSAEYKLFHSRDGGYNEV